LLEQKLKHHIVKKNGRKSKYFKFDEKYVEYIIIPKDHMLQFAKEKKNIFQITKNKIFQKAKEGNFTLSTYIQSNDEIGELAANYNLMIEHIRRNDELKTEK
jgi:signal transduction histidine kinase